MTRKCKKVTVLLDSEEFERFQNYCEGRGFKKSTLIARLIREHLDTENFAMQAELPIGVAGQSRSMQGRGRA